MLSLILSLASLTPTGDPHQYQGTLPHGTGLPACLPIALPPAGHSAGLLLKPYLEPYKGGNCPGPMVHPFASLPRICPLSPCPCTDTPSTSAMSGGMGQSMGSTSNTPSRDIWVREFHEAANFPIPRFNGDGMMVAGEGALIYEGMRLTVYPDDGTYDVSFNVTVPEMPVTIRLQLWFSPSGGDSSPVYRITLPPIRVVPSPNAKAGDPNGSTFQVVHRGRSSLLSKSPRSSEAIPPSISQIAAQGAINRADIPVSITREWEVRRVGTARFGSAVAVDDNNQ